MPNKYQIAYFFKNILNATIHNLVNLGMFFKKIWTGYSYCTNFVRVRGFQRFLIAVFSDIFTLSFVALIIFFMVGQYALVDVEKGWKLYKEYSVTFYDQNNVKIGHRGIKHSKNVPLTELPKHMIMATLATEDRKFFDHLGVDPLGIARALSHNMSNKGGRNHGASTITQQLAKNLFFTSERTLERKIKEAYMAIWLEANLTKVEILSLYFDRMYMGAGNYGLEAAAKYYFGKSIRQVNLSEAAMLAGLFKAPSTYAPHAHLKAAQARANVVLNSLVDSGFMTEAQVANARKNPAIAIQRTKNDNQSEYFIDWVYESAKKLASGSNYILHVKTTIDQNLQADARKAIQDSLTNEGKKYKVDQASLVSMEHDGAVLALIGGEDYGQSQFNRATSSARQPGSSFKPLVYMAALNHGFTPDSTVYDTKVQIKKWAPKNYNRRYIGRTTLNNALVKSINTIPIKLAQEIGYKNVIATAKSLGIDARLVANASLPLGTASISVLDLTGAYATIANGGTLAQPYGITEIRNGSGDLIYKRNRDEYAALVVANPGKVSQLNYMLGNVVEYGTGRRAQLPFTKAFGKTGTTQSYRDAWFMGFTKHLVTGVWFGNDNYSPTNRLTGGRLPASTFKNFMTAAYVSKFNLNLANNTHQGKANIASASKSTYAQNLAHKQANKRTIKKISRNLNIIKISSYSKKSFKNKRSKSVVTFNGKSLSEKSKTKASKKKRKITKKTRRLVKTKKTAKKIYKAKSKSKRKQRKNAAFIDANGNIVILNN